MGMPTIFFYGPRLEKEKKKELIRAFTSAASAATGIREEAFVVYLMETAPEQVGVGGELLEEKLKES
jgi:4-oxalocrotonate tautomerase family enzyme